MSKPEEPQAESQPPWFGPLLAILSMLVFFLTVTGWVLLHGDAQGAWQLGLAMLAAAAAAFMGLVVLLRRHGYTLVGPLFYYDLVSLARKGRTSGLRIAYALFLLAALWIAYGDRFIQAGDETTLDPNEMARLGMSFVTALLIVQTAALFVLTPAYLCGVIHDERERGTLQLLFTTHLRDHEIILGKLAARVLHLGGLLLTGLPVLCLMQFWGGVDGRVLIGAFVATGLSLLSAGSLSILFSVVQPGRVSALVLTYLCLGGFFLTCTACPWSHVSSPLTFVVAADRIAYDPSGFLTYWSLSGPGGDVGAILLGMLFEYALFHVVVAVVCSYWAVRRLRTMTAAHEEQRAVEATLLVESTRPGSPLMDERAGLIFPPPPVTDNPLLWKEVHLGGLRTASQLRDVVFLILFSATLVMFLVLAMVVLPSAVSSPNSFQRDSLQGMNQVVRVLLVLHLGLLCLAVGFRAANAFSRERERHTLDSLLSVPVDREQIVYAKWLGNIVWARGFLYSIAAILALGTVTLTLNPVGAFLTAAAGLVHAAFLSSLGVWLSLVCRGSLRAVFTLAAVLLALVAGPWVVVTFSHSLGGAGISGLAAEFLACGVNPVGCWWQSAFGWSGVGVSDLRLVPISAGLVCYGLAALAFWHLACVALRRERN